MRWLANNRELKENLLARQMKGHEQVNIRGYEVSYEQQQACLKVMTGIFKKEDVRSAAVIAGVPENWPAVGASREEDLPSLVASRLIVMKVRAGTIKEDGAIYHEVRLR